MFHIEHLSPLQLFALTQLSIKEKDIANAVKVEWKKRSYAEIVIEQLNQTYRGSREVEEKLFLKDKLTILFWPLLAFILACKNKNYYTRTQWQQFWRYTALCYLIRLGLFLINTYLLFRP